MNIPEETRAKAEEADAKCQRDNCQRMDCNGFLCVMALEAVFHSAQMEERERVKAAIAKRMAVYEAKRDSSDPLAEDSYTRHQLFSHAAEAMEWLLGELYPDTAIRTTKAD